MGSAASISQEVSNSVAPAFETDVKILFNTLKRLGRHVLEPGEQQDFFDKCKTADIRNWLTLCASKDRESTADGNGNDTSDDAHITDVALRLATANLKHLFDVIIEDSDDEEHYEMPDGPLQDFHPIRLDERVHKIIATLGKPLQRQVHNRILNRSAMKTLKAGVDTLSKNMIALVHELCKKQSIAAICTSVGTAANENFLQVYQSVWNRIIKYDDDGILEYMNVVKGANFTCHSKDVQTESHPVDLLRQAALVKPTYDQFLRNTVASLEVDDEAEDALDVAVPSVSIYYFD